MRRGVATFWHATGSIVAGVLYFLFVLPRWWELMGDTSHALGTGLRIVTGVIVALAALPVVFTLLRARRPEFNTPALALTLQTWSVVAHVVAGVLIVGTAISEIWLNLDNVGQWLFGIYGAAAAIALLGIFGFYLSFVAELPAPPPKPLKPKKDKKQRRSRRKKDDEGEDVDETEEADETEQSDEADEADEPEADADAETADDADTDDEKADETPAEVEPTAVEPESSADEPSADESSADEAPATEDAADSSAAALRNRRPSGKASGAHRRRRTRRGVAVED
jgi:hypothetical protein